MVVVMVFFGNTMQGSIGFLWRSIGGRILLWSIGYGVIGVVC